MHKLLDHGYLKYIGHMGSDETIVETARMSTDKGFLGWGANCTCHRADGEPHPDCLLCGGKGYNRGDEKLLRHLLLSNPSHSTPFESCVVTFEIQAPIFVFREWHRHRTQSYNEMSARYTELPELFYVPDDDRLKFGGQSTGNKQGSGVELVDDVVTEFQNTIRFASRESFAQYHDMLEAGLSRELARLVLPVNTYSRMRATANLWNWMKFLELRHHPKAQYEIRVYAEKILTELKLLFPRTMDLWATKTDDMRWKS